ncbi:MAG: flagellar motor switch protein FliN [Pseudomonadota bacterium]
MSDDQTGESMQLEDMEDEAQAGENAEASANAEATEDDKVATDLESVFEVPVNVSAVLGKTRIPVASLLKLNKGAIVELDRKVGEAIDIYVNNRLVARGEVVVVEERLGVTMTEIVKNDQVN